MDTAPIVISVYDRVEHLKRCVDSLKQNDISQFSDLFVVSDAAHTSAYEGRIAQVRAYINQINGFRRVVPLLRKENLGSYRSVKDAIDNVLNQYGKLIFLEDDNVVAPNFLRFLNDGLVFYQDDPTIFSISAYNYPIRIPSSYAHGIYMWQGFTAWGVGLWADRWQSLTWSYTGFEDLTSQEKRELNRIGEHLYRYIRHDIARGRMIIDTLISYHLFRKRQYTIFPVLSKVRNTGHDGTGEHGGITDLYLQQPIDSGMSYKYIENLQPDERINRILRQHFKTPLKARAMMTFSRFVPEQQKTWLKQRIFVR